MTARGRTEQGSAGWDGYPDPGRSYRRGAWSWELRGSEIADLAVDGRTVLRAVRPIIRDHDWNTPAVMVRSSTETERGLVLDLEIDEHGASFTGELTISISGTQCTVALDLISERAFRTNRTGLVVLHPPALAGVPLTVAHSDGSITETVFPESISPHQPVRDIRALSWGEREARVETVLRGDVFEMEDQRNWTDASYKTYSRPLELQFPYTVATGERVRQAIEISVPNAPEIAAEVPPAECRIELRAAGTFPAIGVGASTAPDPAPARVGPRTNFVLVELDLRTPNWRAALSRASCSRAPLDVRIIWDDDDDLLAEAVKVLAPLHLLRVAIFDGARHITLPAALAALVDTLAAARVDTELVGGTRAHFTEYNRECHALAGGLSGIVFSTTPLFHDLSTEQLEESIEMQRLVARQATQMARPLPVHVGPVTLRPRFNNVATETPRSANGPGLETGYGAALTGANDPRQLRAEFASWTAASAAALAVPGVASIAYFEEWGPRGIRSERGDPYPAAKVVELLATWSGRELLTAESPDGRLWAVGARETNGDAILVANLSAQDRDVWLTVSGREEDARVKVAARGWAIIELG